MMDYFYNTSSKTICSTDIKEDIPVICDMSSDILYRPFDVSKYALAQMNVGSAGVTVVIVKKSTLGKVSRYIPKMLNYRTRLDNGSIFNTPLVIPILVMNETLKSLKSIGNVEAIQKINQKTADMLYAEIDRSSIFVGATEKSRSNMKVCPVMTLGKAEFEAKFIECSKGKKMISVKSVSSVGGLRALIHNARTVEDVKALIDCINEFEVKYI